MTRALILEITDAVARITGYITLAVAVVLSFRVGL